MVGGIEGNFWQTWTEGKSGEDRCALGWAAEQRSIYKTGRDHTEKERHLPEFSAKMVADKPHQS